MLKLILTPVDKTRLVLQPESELRGLGFMAKARECLRRNLDISSKNVHHTLGSLAQYEIIIDETTAVASGKYGDKDDHVITVSNDFLKRFVFYSGNFSYVTGKTYPRNAVYPYFVNSIILQSLIDENKVIELWKTQGYPDHLD